ncbi:hypothetical protein B0T26DRAFT_316153 [Lasiosphaeria miniovina]|uniref:Uncharacterized protein n=1 Tax=Lasiosphaeria miniovina TaxID=1954250 RepID=A0AA40ALQ5_9PEZI|nr:uncharacterized protein B0T26DRAFT_316153 [Lasiosphaeria miniovina]KAK0718163.1 hypothetical protein B0T26DRAFT_316153 [Lasiosphaeria miniovina]
MRSIPLYPTVFANTVLGKALPPLLIWFSAALPLTPRLYILQPKFVGSNGTWSVGSVPASVSWLWIG